MESEGAPNQESMLMLDTSMRGPVANRVRQSLLSHYSNETQKNYRFMDFRNKLDNERLPTILAGDSLLTRMNLGPVLTEGRSAAEDSQKVDLKSKTSRGNGFQSAIQTNEKLKSKREDRHQTKHKHSRSFRDEQKSNRPLKDNTSNKSMITNNDFKE